MGDFTQAEYEKLNSEFDEIQRNKNNTLFKKFKRKVESLYKSEDRMQDEAEEKRRGQQVMGAREHKLYRRIVAMERQMIRDGNRGGK